MTGGTRKPDVVLVTGASGFIGSALVRHLAARYRVVALDRERPPEAPPVAESIDLDLGSDRSVQAALERVRQGYGARIASVIHLAAYFDLTGEPNPLYEEITVRGTERLLKALQELQVEQFVFASTLLVHAPTRPGTPIDEDSPLDPKLPYRASKIETEQLIREQHGDIPVVLLRPAGVYDNQGHAAFLAHQIARIFERKLNSRVYPGNLDTGQPFLHLDDLCDALRRLIERRQELPLLLAETEAPSFSELQDRIGCALHGEPWKTRKIPEPVARLGATVENRILDDDPFIRPWMVDIASDHYEVDISRARQLLDWKPKHSLRRTLPRIIEALQADPQAWYQSNKLNPATIADKAPAVLGAPEAEAASAGAAGTQHGDGKPDPSAMQQHRKDMRDMHFQMQWVHWLNLALGAWLLASPFAFGLFDPQTFSAPVLQVTAERGLADPASRLQWLGWNDAISGTLVMLFAALSLSPRFNWAQWANAAVGFWLLFAPLVFWSPSAAVYNNDTLVGTLVIAFAILVPMMPGMSHEAMMDPSDLPPGWTYSPSTYLQRLPIVAF